MKRGGLHYRSPSSRRGVKRALHAAGFQNCDNPKSDHTRRRKWFRFEDGRIVIIQEADVTAYIMTYRSKQPITQFHPGFERGSGYIHWMFIGTDVMHFYTSATHRSPEHRPFVVHLVGVSGLTLCRRSGSDIRRHAGNPLERAVHGPSRVYEVMRNVLVSLRLRALWDERCKAVSVSRVNHLQPPVASVFTIDIQTHT